MSLSLKYDYDFDFNGDKSNRFIPFIVGFLMYSVTIAIMSCFFTNNLTTEWSDALNGHMTIEFQSNVDGADETLTARQKEEVVQIVQSTPGIKFIRELRETDILKILEPWLAGTAIPDDFPFPTIFDVEFEKEEQIDLLLLSDQLSKVSQGVRIHNHANWHAPILKISNALFSFAILLSVLIFATVCATVIFITKKTLNVHHNIVKILQLIGANKAYIASQFKRYYFAIGCKASFISIVLSMMTIFSINYISSAEMFGINTLQYSIIAVVLPMLTTILVMQTSKSTVLFFLNNDEWID